ncbi:MAG: HoxN/HupN/NixA family nickel/cobalt transporter [Armatimonadetes bacterium]|nr:HoxN/HupN/NixA family nickel/cobalt transporter [Armatimonadota bacterium]
MRRHLILLYLAIFIITAAGWAWWWLASNSHPILFSMGILAYVLGVRHALDADHIAAIDNTTRKLMNEGQKPISVGWFFALGHSTIVAVLAIALAASSHFVATHIPSLERLGGILGTVVSAFFLYLIAILNLVILRDLFHLFQQVHRRSAEQSPPENLEELLQQRGLMNRIIGPLNHLIHRSWQMYPIGVLFGLGFDTASEVVLLGMSASVGVKSLPAAEILVLPLLFAAGMTLVDTTDGVLMTLAYDWAFQRPVRKVYYNLTITTMSVLVALLIGTVEWLQVLSHWFTWNGPLGKWVQNLDIGGIGYEIVAILLLTWVISVWIYKAKGFDHEGMEETETA